MFLKRAYGKPANRSCEFNAKTQPKPEIAAKNAKNTKILTTDGHGLTRIKGRNMEAEKLGQANRTKQHLTQREAEDRRGSGATSTYPQPPELLILGVPIPGLL